MFMYRVTAYHCQIYHHSPRRKSFTESFYTKEMLHKKPFAQRSFYAEEHNPPQPHCRYHCPPEGQAMQGVGARVGVPNLC